MNEKAKYSHRKLELIEALHRLGGSARNSDLATALSVSEETIRRTIKSLSKTGSVTRVHGGAYLTGSKKGQSFFRRIGQQSEEKQIIARETASLISDGMTLFLDVGSTTAFIGEELWMRQNLTVATNSVSVAQALVGHNDNRVFLLGGEMQGSEQGAFGFVTEQQARRFAYDLAVLSADALSPQMGFLYRFAAEANLAAVVSECAEQTVMAVTHNKFGETEPHRGFSPDRIDKLVSDKAPKGKLRTQLDKWGIELLIAETDGTEPDE
ncbi:MAG: DeoR/GlpR family DNA-binding transcription regulator [Paracoccaceae bacterium]